MWWILTLPSCRIVFGRRDFDARGPVVRVLPGRFGNLFRVLVPDAAATPMEFHRHHPGGFGRHPGFPGQAHCVMSSYHPPSSLAPWLCSHICINGRRTWNTYAGPVGSSILVSSAVEREVLAPTVEYTQLVIWVDIIIMDHHLERGQLWRCPVEWCTVWKGSVQDCMDHLRSKHKGTHFLGLKTLGKFFPPWTVSREFWKAAL